MVIAFALDDYMEYSKTFKDKISTKFQGIRNSLSKLKDKRRISEKLSELKRISSFFSDIKLSLSLFQDDLGKKISQNWKDFTEKVTDIRNTINQKFSGISERFDTAIKKLQPDNGIIRTEILDDLQVKQLIQGQMTFEDVASLTTALWENHDLAQQAFADTNDLQFYEMAMDILLVIQELERLKEYLDKHGKF